jgi:hypothetical protein
VPVVIHKGVESSNLVGSMLPSCPRERVSAEVLVQMLFYLTNESEISCSNLRRPNNFFSFFHRQHASFVMVLIGAGTTRYCLLSNCVANSIAFDLHLICWLLHLLFNYFLSWFLFCIRVS